MEVEEEKEEEEEAWFSTCVIQYGYHGHFRISSCVLCVIMEDATSVSVPSRKQHKDSYLLIVLVSDIVQEKHVECPWRQQWNNSVTLQVNCHQNELILILLFFISLILSYYY